MRIVSLIAILCSFGCSQIDRSKTTRATEKQDHVSVALENLEYVDMFSAHYTTEHPLVCGAGGDFPAGRELIFRHSETGESVHAVFPEKVTAPEKFNGHFVLRGHFQGIQNRSRYKFKRPPQDYRYFVVSSWEHRN